MTRLRCSIRLLLDDAEPAHTAISFITRSQRIPDKRARSRTVGSDISPVRWQVEAHNLAARCCRGGDHSTTCVDDHAARALPFSTGQPDAIYDGRRLLGPIEEHRQNADGLSVTRTVLADRRRIGGNLRAVQSRGYVNVGGCVLI